MGAKKKFVDGARDVCGSDGVRRCAGVLFPVFSMRRKNDLGIGDTRTVRQCLDWFSAHKVGFLQLLPINVTGGDRSPYSAISSVALDPIYLDLEQIAGVGPAMIRKAREASGMAHISASVNYPTVVKVKQGILRVAFERFCKVGDFTALEIFKKKEKKWLENYVKYRWLIDEAGGVEDWSQWPEEFNHCAKAKVYERKRRRTDREAVELSQNYYAWEQWHGFAQWKAVRKHADRVGVKLMGDVPIGVSYASADVFFEPEWFHLDLFGGAPPETEFEADAFTTKWGQNWGVPVYRWDVIEKSDFRWWRQRVESLSSIFHQFRIDHILGFYRIYSFPWHPRENARFLPMNADEVAEETGGTLPGFYPREDDTVVNKALNLLDGDRFIRAVVDAADGAEVIGEDLGTVPDYVRPHLLEIDIAGFKICHWELDGKGRVIDGGEYPECSYACYSTHDMAPLRSQWEDARAEAIEGPDRRGALLRLRNISEFAGLKVYRKGSDYPAFSHKVKHALLESLLKSNARYAGVPINGVGDSPIQINFPGTVGDQNWTYRVNWEFEEIPKWMEKEMDVFTRMIVEAGRG